MCKKIEIPKSALAAAKIATAKKVPIKPYTEQERQLVEETNERIREAQYKNALACLHAKDFIAL